MRTELARLEEQQVALSIFVAQNESIVSPLRSLIPEVLALIFIWALPRTTDIFNPTAFDRSTAPWNVTHTCTRWRAIAIDTPALWSLLTIDFLPRRSKINSQASIANPHFAIADTQSLSLPSYSLDMVKTHIQRAATLKIHFRTASGPVEPQRQLFALLVEHCPRWEQLYLAANPEILPRTGVLVHQLPLLCRMCLRFESGAPRNNGPAADATNITTIAAFTAAAPTMQDISLVLGIRMVNIIPILPSGHLLTHYDLSAPWSTHVHMLRTTTAIVSARICVWGRRGVGDHAIAPITLPRLRRLYASDPHIFRLLTAPSLKQLAIEFGNGDSGAVAIAAFVQRSACSFASLSVCGDALIDGVMRILNEHVFIEELNIMTHNSVTYTLLDRMRNEVCIAKQLGRVSVAPDTNFHYEALCESIGPWAGVQSDSGLRELTIISQRPTPAERVHFEELIGHGWKLVVLECDDALFKQRDLRCLSQWPKCTH